MNRTLRLLLPLMVISQTAVAQKTIAAWAAADDKSFAKGHQYSNTLNHLKTSVKKGWLTVEQIPQVKRVGLLNYVIVQPTFQERDATSIYSHYLTPAGTETFLGKLLPPVLAGLNSTFETKQMTLLLPEQYVDTDAKKTLYAQKEFENSGLMKAVAAIAAHFNKSREAAAAGYIGKFVTMINSDIKVWRHIGQFSKDLGTDALLAIEQTIWFDGKEAFLGGVTMNLVMPNPTPQTDKTSYAPVGPLKGYLEGFLMGTVTVSRDPILIAEVKKKEIAWKDLDGLQTVYARLAENLVNYANAELEEAKK